MLDTPILFIIFNRPILTQRVFKAIRAARPKELFIAADGPRQDRPDDIDKCFESREIIKSIDWDCQVKTLFRNENLGCGLSVSSAISWFFSHVKYGIILEDDCLPLPSFFTFCSELLIRYEYDTRIMHISGANGLSTEKFESSYIFSRLPGSWGWASWRRAWDAYDFDTRRFPLFKSSQMIYCLFPEKEMAEFQLKKYEIGHSKTVDTWDYQWQFCLVAEGGLSITPTKNLIRNIGFGPDATHTFQKSKLYDEQIFLDMTFPLIHPPFIIHYCSFDYLAYLNYYKPSQTPLKNRIKSYVPNILKRFIKNILF